MNNNKLQKNNDLVPTEHRDLTKSSRAVIHRGLDLARELKSEIPINVYKQQTYTQPLTQTWKCVNTLVGHSYGVYYVAFNPDGKTLASGSYDYSIKLWNLDNCQPICTVEDNSRWFFSVAISPDWQTIATGCDSGAIKLWQLYTGNSVGILAGHFMDVTCVAFSPLPLTSPFLRGTAGGSQGGILVSGSLDNTIKLWHPNRGEEIRTLTGHDGEVFSVAISPDGQTLVSGSWDNTIKLWDLDTGEELHTIFARNVRYIAISPDGQTLTAGCADGTVKLWHIGTGSLLDGFTGHKDGIRFLAFSPDGNTLASASEDNTIKLWHLATGKVLCTLRGHSDRVRCVAFSPDGTTLASGSDDNTIKIWQLAPEL
ncbi:WD40 repeat domain-containing protein [Microseira wollei]|uniref:WD-40 repeat protein n=1 Tax=Microseira wollei NIES-4236 TaxID=2530354 RepID=A0AAV3XLK3_9CYAN|nr:WD40 repeat domain-containing protein [Microseira wollei]GET43354.1 WD-40 repeat protein [Microseira wollei NIES-4236]